MQVYNKANIDLLRAANPAWYLNPENVVLDLQAHPIPLFQDVNAQQANISLVFHLFMQKLMKEQSALCT